ncbi:MAG TPA: tetratricopeptide repeat protein, partial [Nitrospiraceae bacterium]|nr:tetratricopeptide repeat protein [Nitrospiraceae bacterium]
MTNTFRLFRWTVLVAAPLLLAGCASLRGRDAGSEAYDQARREIEGPNENYGARYADESEVGQGWSWSDLSPDNIPTTFKKLIGRGPNPAVARQLMAEADELRFAAIQSRDQDPEGNYRELFVEAGKKYSEAADRWPKSAVEQDSLYHAGECYFFADHYPDAEEAYEMLFKQHPHSRYLDQVQPHRFAIAQYWLELHDLNPEQFYEVNLTDQERPWRSTKGHALRVYDRIRLDDPTGKLADDATLALGNVHFANHRFIQADEYYTDLRKTFPSSEHQFMAHFLGLKAKVESYQGADYSANALDGAEKLIDQIRKQFPVEAEREREYLQRAYAEVRYRKAERDWLMGQRSVRRSNRWP